jgi:hypothetical protein
MAALLVLLFIDEWKFKGTETGITVAWRSYQVSLNSSFLFKSCVE